MTEDKCICCKRNLITGEPDKDFLCVSCGLFSIKQRKKVLEEVNPFIEKIRECALGQNDTIVNLCDQLKKQLSEVKDNVF